MPKASEGLGRPFSITVKKSFHIRSKLKIIIIMIISTYEEIGHGSSNIPSEISLVYILLFSLKHTFCPSYDTDIEYF